MSLSIEEKNRIKTSVVYSVWNEDVANVETWTKAIIAALEEYDKIAQDRLYAFTKDK